MKGTLVAEQLVLTALVSAPLRAICTGNDAVTCVTKMSVWANAVQHSHKKLALS
jgi:hypothetical protein